MKLLEKIEERIELYCQIYERAYGRVSELFCDAGEVALRIFGEVARDLRDGNSVQQTSMRNEKQENSLATKRQREALHKFGVKLIPENLAREEASEVLERLIGLSKGNDRENISRTVEELNRRWKEKSQQPKK